MDIFDSLIGAFDQAHSLAWLLDCRASGVFDVPVYAEYNIGGIKRRGTIDTADKTLIGMDADRLPLIRRRLTVRFHVLTLGKLRDEKRVLQKEVVRTSMPCLFDLCERCLPDFTHVLVDQNTTHVGVYPCDECNQHVFRFVFSKRE